MHHCIAVLCLAVFYVLALIVVMTVATLSYRQATQGHHQSTWSCEWAGAANLDACELSVARYGAVPSVGYCYHTQGPKGVARYSPQKQAQVLRLFEQHKAMRGGTCGL